MADWRDGAEYAPAARPKGFATPRAEPLSEPALEPSPADGRPLLPPDQFTAPPASPLATLSPRPPAQRDPHRAFDTDSSSGLGSAWGGTGSRGWTPTQPMLLDTTTGLGADSASTLAPPTFAPPTGAPVVAGPAGVPGPGVPVPGNPGPGGYPQPSTQPWGAPPPGAVPMPGTWGVPPRATEPASSPMLGWVLFLCLLLGGLIWPLSVFLGLAAVLVARQMRPRPTLMVRVIAIALGVSVVFGALAALGSDPGEGWHSFSALPRLACWLLAIYTGGSLLASRRR